MHSVEVSDWIQLLRMLVLVAGGAWALFMFRTWRRGEVSIAIEHEHRLLREFAPGRSLLLVRTRLRNTSNVLWRWEQSTVTLFDARRLVDDRSLRVVPFAQADPFLSAYGFASEDPSELAAGETFRYEEGQQISLEPGEAVESEVAFPLDDNKLGLMGVHVWFRGRQRTRAGEPYEWATFFYVDPTDATDLPRVGSEAA
jgi:hypothetical protein